MLIPVDRAGYSVGDPPIYQVTLTREKASKPGEDNIINHIE